MVAPLVNRVRLRTIGTVIGIVGTVSVAIWLLMHLRGDPPRTPHEPIGLTPAASSAPS